MLRRKSFLRLIHLMLCVFLLLGFHSRALFHPGDYYFDLESDGMRTYYVMMYHVADLSAPDFKFRGMNYPFGENLNYMDALPLVTVLFRAGGRMGWQMPSIPGFLNLTMLLSIPIASILLLEILFRYARPSLLSVIFALGTAFTMPQIHRIYHHFGLGFLFVIPLFWFLFLKMREADKSLSGKGKVTASSVIFRLFIVFLTIAAAFVHFYYAFFSAILIGFLTAMNRTSWQRRALDFFVLAAIPMGIVRLLLFLSGDGRTDRISRPYGSFGRNYYSSPGDIFLPNYKSTFWEIAWRPWHLGTWEGEAFVGFAVIFILFIFIYFARRKKREGTLKKRIFQSVVRRPFLWSALALSFYATGAIFWLFPDAALDHFPSVLKQFRSIGRISWIAFLFFALVSFRFLSALGRIKNLRQYAQLMTLAVLLLFSYDITEANLRLARDTSSENLRIDRQDDSPARLSSDIRQNEFQALIALPYYNTGTDVRGLVRQPLPGMLFASTQLSLKAGIPMTDMMGARSPIDLARSQYDIYTGRRNGVCSFYPDKRDFLVLLSDEGRKAIEEGRTEMAPDFPGEKQIIKKIKYIVRRGNYSLYRLAFKDVCP